MGSVLESRESSKNERWKTDIIYKTMYANSEDFQVLAISTMVSLFGAEWNDHKKSTPFSHECSVQELLTRCGASDSRFRCVFVCIAAVFSAFQLLRRVAMNTRREAISFSQLLPQICCVI